MWDSDPFINNLERITLYYVLYDYSDNIVGYFDTLIEFTVKLHLDIYEVKRKFRNTSNNFIGLIHENKKYRLYVFD